MTPEAADLVAALRDPAAYPRDPDDVDVRETPISWVFLAGDRAYKVKKPVTLPFLDYGSRERRRELCREEVRLNRRLAPDAYLGVGSIVERGDRLTIVEEDRDGAVEWAVAMRRLPEDRTMDALLERGVLSAECTCAVGARLARFHAEAERAGPEYGDLASVKRPTDENFETLLDAAVPDLEPRRLVAAQRFSDAFLAGRREQLLARAAGGRVRDGHGDLRLEHVVLDDGIQVFDCVEFDPALRRIDVACDLAFLVMELEARGAEPLARELVTAYRTAGGDAGDDALLAFYAAYRAWVRAKVAYLAGHEGARLAAIAERFRWRARLPLALVLCGVTAAGKSVLADAIARPAGMPVLSSDRVRKRLAGLEPTARADERQYSDASSLRTYRELGALARERLERGGGAIVDATFRRAQDREAFAATFGDRRAAVFVECCAPRPVLLERARQRERQGNRVSDATEGLVDRQLHEFAPLDEVPADSHLSLRTDRDTAETVDELEAHLDRRMTRAHVR